jgi:hypothetical protein
MCIALPREILVLMNLFCSNNGGCFFAHATLSTRSTGSSDDRPLPKIGQRRLMPFQVPLEAIPLKKKFQLRL